MSEFVKDAPDAAVLAWAQDIDPAHLIICVVTLGEIERGPGRLPEGAAAGTWNGGGPSGGHPC